MFGSTSIDDLGSTQKQKILFNKLLFYTENLW